MDIDLHADLLRGVKEGEGRGPAALFTSADAIITDEFLRNILSGIFVTVP